MPNAFGSTREDRRLYLRHLEPTRAAVEDRLFKEELGHESHLSLRSRVLYYLFKADRLVDLILLAENQDLRQKHVKDADGAFTKALAASVKLLGPVDALSIQIVLHRALMLSEVASKPDAAWHVAESMYRDCESKVDKADDRQVSMLHMLRNFKAHLEKKLMEAEGAKDQLLKMDSAYSEGAAGKTSRGLLGGKATDRDKSNNKKVSQMRELFQAASYVPLVLEQLPHAAQIEHAIRSIFKCYVKGQFAPAETRAGEMVRMNGKAISLGDYLLEGPYMKWDGFLSLCHDFHICARTDGKGSRATGVRPSEDFLFTTPQLAAIFASTAGAAGGRPVLATAECLEKQQQQQQRGAGGGGSRRTSGSSARGGEPMPTPSFGPDKELWDRVSAVLRGKAELQPSEGLNFDQFLDCLARCALVAFSSNPSFNYAEMYPTNADKLQALFTTHMALLDARHWGQACRMHTLLSSSCSSLDMKDLADVYAQDGGGSYSKQQPMAAAV